MAGEETAQRLGQLGLGTALGQGGGKPVEARNVEQHAPNARPQQVATLRTAFSATMKDPAYLAEMQKSNRELSPLGGGEMQKMMQEVAAVPQATLVKLNSWIRRQ